MNPAVLRSEAIRAARGFFAAEHLLEVRTNRLVSSAAMEPYIDGFAITGADGNHLGYLATSPEFALKKLFSAELGASPAAQGIYEIAPVFRDDRPGKNHSSEFTMLEWYRRDYTLAEIISQALRLINHLAATMRISEFHAGVTEFQITAEFEKILQRPLPADKFRYTQVYKEHFGALPHHVNPLDAEIACFNLLFDAWLLPVIKNQAGLVCVSGYPECLAAMARVTHGIAERTEIFYAGLELANAYCEEYDAGTIRERWAANNEIRRLRGVAEHPLDERLLETLSCMKGVSGIAVGLERLLIAFFPQLSARSFSES
ncbi:amino acid--tRNA ligase-related protein [Turneriella parva]|uniref:tRNA synthetase class II (D K and N) n=1 Tax=Turneriella parva (strain ATCC BAA-1111 / DSM 21527 / NCTC 11395 / H) TaxID=869212 RepID=I4B0Y1_TURPD|nr:amino acid--tRNA ligase-related protein [Turneriella parva]AFM10938.1 tRNA synthetase class II (D K and N) [Turneriella parva DSM 21527]